MKTKFIHFNKWYLGALVLALTIGIWGCSKETPGANQVWMQNTAFNPSTLTVSKNATVTWTNKDNMSHNVTSDAGLFASSTLTPGQTYSYQFTATGTYPYHCTIHVGMTGTIVVQ
jgi:plastocyanin